MQYRINIKGHLRLKALDDSVIIIDCDAEHAVCICDGRWGPVKVENVRKSNFFLVLDVHIVHLGALPALTFSSV